MLCLCSFVFEILQLKSFPVHCQLHCMSFVSTCFIKSISTTPGVVRCLKLITALCILSITSRLKSTPVVSRYYDTAGIRKKYHNIQTIELSSTNF